VFTFDGKAALALETYGWFMVDNGYLVSWTEDGAYMTVVQDLTATGVGRVGQPVLRGAGICMSDGQTLTVYDRVGGVLYNGTLPPVKLAEANWRRVALDRLSTARVLHKAFPPHGLPSVLGFNHIDSVALYLVGNERGDNAILVRQWNRPEILGVMAEMAVEGLDLPDWK
jgi:hypothetical protein